MRSAPALSLDVASSRIARFCFAVVASLALLSIWITGFAVPMQAALTVFLLAVAATAWRSLHVAKVRRAVLQSDGIWLVDANNNEVTVRLESSSLLGSLIGLRWRDVASGAVITLLLWPDSIDGNTRRLLRTWLRSGRAHLAESSTPDPGA